MSYYEDDAGDDYMTSEQAYEMGWMDNDDVAELRTLVKHFELSDPFPRPGNRNDAILVLLDHKLNPPTTSAPEDPNVTWAKLLLRDIL